MKTIMASRPSKVGSAARTAHFATLDEVWKQVERLKAGLPEGVDEKKK